MKRSKTFKIGLIVSIIPFILGGIFYRSLPDQIATHFDINNNPDAYSSKNFALFGLPAIMLLVYLSAYFFTSADPKKSNQGDKALNIVLIALPLINIVISAATIAFGLGKKIDIATITTSLVAILMIFIGNYLPKVKRNYTIGIKLPWTMNSDYVWEKTHVLAGKVYMLGGFLILISSILLNNFYFFIGVFVLMTFIPIIYSYKIYRDLSKDGEDEN